MSDVFENKGAMAATIVVAASDSLNKGAANFTCPGADDQITIQAAIDASSAGDTLVLLPGNYLLRNCVTPKANMTISAPGAVLKLADADTSLLTANANAAQADVVVADGSKFFVGQWVAVTDDAAVTLIKGGITFYVADCTTILSIAGNTITLSQSLVNNYTTAQNGYLTSASSLIYINTTNGVTIEGCELDGNKANQSLIQSKTLPALREETRSLSCIVAYYSDNTIIDSVHAHDGELHNITIDNSDNCQITSSRIHACYFKNILGYAAEKLSITENYVYDAVGEDGIILYTGCPDSNISLNHIWNNPRSGIAVQGSDNCKIASNWISSPETGENPKAIDVNNEENIVISGNTVNAGRVGIYVDEAVNVAITGNTVVSIAPSGSTEFLVFIKGNIDMHVRITGNTIDGVNKSQGGVRVGWAGTDSLDYISIADNTIRRCAKGIWVRAQVGSHTNAFYNTLEDNATSIGDDSHLLDYSDQYSDTFEDVLAASANYIVNAQNLVNGVAALTGTQPNYPRGLDCTITEGAPGDVSDYTMTVVGTNAKGETITEVFTFADDGLIFSSDNAFDHVTSVTLADVADIGAATFVMGIDERLGLMNPIYETSDVWKITKNLVRQVVAGAQVDVDYDIYDMSVIGLAVNDDFIIWYRSNLNVIS